MENDNNKKFMEWYKDHSVNICNSTVNVGDLLRYLFAKKLVSESGKALVESIAGAPAQCDALYPSLVKSGFNRIDDIIYCLTASLNEHIAAIFLEFKANPDLGAGADTRVAGSDGSIVGRAWFGFPDMVASFHGRETEADELHDRLKEALVNQAQTCVIVSAFAGFGKSSLCNKYAHKYYEFYHCHAIWLNAETETTLTQSFQELIDELGIQAEANGKKKDLKALAKEMYEKFQPNMLLVVFDNAEDHKLIRSCLPHGLPPGGTKPSILITTQKKPLIEPPKGDTYELKSLLLEDGIDFIRKNLGLESDDAAANINANNAKELFDTMGGHPLALQHAIGYIRQMHSRCVALGKGPYTISKYLEDFRRSRDLELFSELSAELEDYGKTAFATVQMALKRITANSEVGRYAVAVLNIAAGFDPDQIDATIIANIIQETYFIPPTGSGGSGHHKIPDKIMEDALLLPVSYNLYELNDMKIKIHRLVQFVLLRTAPPDDPVHDKVFRYFMMIESLGSKPNELKHAASAWSQCNDDVVLANHVRLFSKIVDGFNESRWWLKARAFIAGQAGTLERLQARLGDWDKGILDAKAALGRCLQETIGDFPGAYKLLKEALRGYEETLDNKSLETMGAKYGLGVSLHQMGRFEEAVKVHQELYQVHKLVFGEEHPETLRNLTKIGVAGDFCGRKREGAEIYARVYAIRQRLLGDDDPLTLESRHNIACSLHYLGREEEALKVYCEVYEKQVRILGPEHCDTVNNKHMMSITIDALGKYEEAVDSFKEVFEAQERILGKEHPDTLMTKFNMALSLLRLGRYEDAAQANQEVLDIQRRVLGEDHYFTRKTANNLSACQRRARAGVAGGKCSTG